MGEKKRVVVTMNDDYDTRWSVRDKVRATTGITIKWREGENYHFHAKVMDVEAMKNAGLSVKEVTE